MPKRKKTSKKSNIKESSEKKKFPSLDMPRKVIVFTPEREKAFKKLQKEFGKKSWTDIVDMFLDVGTSNPENFRASSIHKSTNGNMKEQLELLKELLPKESETLIQQGEQISSINKEITDIKENITLLTKMIAEINPKSKEILEEKLKSEEFFKEKF